jgi:DNA repair protein RecN (Recombination protein N)
LEEVETRLATLDKLKRKYGATLEEVLSFLGEVRGHLEAMESAEERREALRKEQAKLAEAYESAAARLTTSRREAARKLERRIETELKSLAMERTVFRIAIAPVSWSARGADSVRFLVSPNPGEEPRPLEKVASGGELSRIALALKTCVTITPKIRGRARQAPHTLVFDEIDSGVGGSAAETLGRRLKQLGGASQVLCVTHLPQIAGFAEHHYLVEKREVKGRTVASIQELTGEARTREIGRMLSGQRLTPEALRHAEQLIKTAAG